MFYLAYPTAKGLAKVLLQTTPDSLFNGVENRLREIRQDPNVAAVDRIHFWQNTYGQCVGTIEVQLRSEADEQATLRFIYQKLEGLTSNAMVDGDRSELTVSIIKLA
ncbi:Two-component response regulator-like APRR1 [Apophysomyces ossiformis]|uniref:Two-component response regulator-like APRR1 n=1 Tax=Apophysomyces ossiformis TaxID=679940 RepID=A0A8H7BY35_9FUNG|nr:Two-component response regulator-like APRR1 [Apophysomyces ossiformis]